MATNDVQVDAQIDTEVPGSTPVEPPESFKQTKDDRPSSLAPLVVEHQTRPCGETEHLLYLKHLKLDLQEDIIDVLIISAEEDREKAQQFRDQIKNIQLNFNDNVRHVNAKLLDDVVDGSAETLDLAFSKAIYIFLYITEEFCNCNLTILKSNACLKEAIEDNEKQKCVIPVHTKPKAERNYRLPQMMTGLRPINWNGDRDDFLAVKHLLEANTGYILEREKELDEQRKQQYKKEKPKIQELMKFLKQQESTRQQSDETAMKYTPSAHASPAPAPRAGAQNPAVEQDCQGYPELPRSHYSYQ